MDSVKNVYAVVNAQNEVQVMRSGIMTWDSANSAKKAIVCDLLRINYLYHGETRDEALDTGRLLWENKKYTKRFNGVDVTFDKFSDILPYLLGNGILRIVNVSLLTVGGG